MGHKAQPKYDGGCEDQEVGPLEAVLVVHHGDTSHRFFLTLTLSSYSQPFHSVHSAPVARTLQWFAIPSSSGPYFVGTLHYDLSILGGPARQDS